MGHVKALPILCVFVCKILYKDVIESCSCGGGGEGLDMVVERRIIERHCCERIMHCWLVVASKRSVKLIRVKVEWSFLSIFDDFIDTLPTKILKSGEKKFFIICYSFWRTPKRVLLLAFSRDSPKVVSARWRCTITRLVALVCFVATVLYTFCYPFSSMVDGWISNPTQQ